MSGEIIPICDYCPMRESIEATDDQMSDARGIAVDVAYNDFIEPSKIRDEVEARGIDSELASFAADCLGNIQRRYCIKADRGYTDGSNFGVTPRTEF